MTVSWCQWTGKHVWQRRVWRRPDGFLHEVYCPRCGAHQPVVHYQLDMAAWERYRRQVLRWRESRGGDIP